MENLEYALLQKGMAILAGALVFVATGPYIYAIWKGHAVPSKATWIVWFTLSAITAWAMFAKDALNPQIAAVAAADAAILGLTLKYGMSGWQRIEKWSLGAAGIGILVWSYTNEPVFGIVMSQIVTFVGSIPTFAKTWLAPESEPKYAWLIMFGSSALQTASLQELTVEAALQPIVFLVVGAGMVALTFLRPRRFLVRT